MSKFMLRIYNIWHEEIQELAITPSRGERVSVYGHRNVDPPPPSSWLTVATQGREPAKLIYRLLLHTEIKNPLDKKSSSSLS